MGFVIYIAVVDLLVFLYVLVNPDSLLALINQRYLTKFGVFNENFLIYEVPCMY